MISWLYELHGSHLPLLTFLFSGVNKQDVHSVPEVDKANITEEDEEYARIMARLDELEKEEELAAGNDNQGDEEDEEEKGTSNQSLEKFHDEELRFSKVMLGLDALTRRFKAHRNRWSSTNLLDGLVMYPLTNSDDWYL